MTPLIKIKLLINEKIEILGVYGPGENVSLINVKLLNIKNKNNNVNIENLRTINGVTRERNRRILS